MGPPGQANSRNYGADYFIVVSPENGALKIDTIRHAYLHFTLDPVVGKRSTTTLKRLEPLLLSVKTAPMSDAFKTDIVMLVTESLIRAVEARTAVTGKGRQAEIRRHNLAQSAAEEGFILAPYFEEQLVKFEPEPDYLQDAFAAWLASLDVSWEQKRAAGIVFASTARPEGLQTLKKQTSLLDEAGQRFAAGDMRRARQLAQQALDEKKEDQGRAMFILAQVATRDRDIERAQDYFERAAAITSDANVVAWSHVYLGRIFDLKAERDSAVKHYQQALATTGSDGGARRAAENGVKEPYQPPTARQQEQQ
jgi:tetratricopeptide (TPR) repeat protein